MVMIRTSLLAISNIPPYTIIHLRYQIHFAFSLSQPLLFLHTKHTHHLQYKIQLSEVIFGILYKTSLIDWYSDGYNASMNNGRQKKKTPKKTVRQGTIQFTIRIQVNEEELKIFHVYEADSSIDAARKLVQNLWLHEDQVLFWTAYIEERRQELELVHVNTSTNYSPTGTHSNGSICTFSIFKFCIYLKHIFTVDSIRLKYLCDIGQNSI